MIAASASHPPSVQGGWSRESGKKTLFGGVVGKGDEEKTNAPDLTYAGMDSRFQELVM